MLRYDRAGADLRIVANIYVPDEGRAGTNINAVSKSGYSARIIAGYAKSDAVIKRHARSDAAISIDNYAAPAVREPQPGTAFQVTRKLGSDNYLEPNDVQELSQRFLQKC